MAILGKRTMTGDARDLSMLLSMGALASSGGLASGTAPAGSKPTADGAGGAEWSTSVTLTVSDNNVSNPPTDAELDTAFGTPATVGTGWVGVVDDNNAELNVWLCVAIGTSWWYVAMTKAV